MKVIKEGFRVIFEVSKVESISLKSELIEEVGVDVLSSMENETHVEGEEVSNK